MNEFLFTQVMTELEDAVGRENCSVRAIDKLAHSVDYFWLSRMWADRGRRMPEADFIVSPKDAHETSKVMKIANYYKIPVTTWGGGGGTQGGAIPVCGGILLDTKRMDKIYEINEEGMYIECGAGTIYKHLEWAANERGYATMHYPSSLTCSTVGGFLAHRGIGVVSTKYGKIDDMVLQMEVVLPNGDIIYTSPAPKHAAGPDLNQIFIGSEGTYGIITKAQMRIYRQPEVRRFRGFLFKDMHGAFEAGREILQKFKPSVMRLYDDAETASLIKKIVGVQKPGAFMNVAYEGVKELVDVEEKLLLETFKKYGKNYVFLSRQHDGFAADVRHHGYDSALRQNRKNLSGDEKRRRKQFSAGEIHSAFFALVRMGLHDLRQIYNRGKGRSVRSGRSHAAAQRGMDAGRSHRHRKRRSGQRPSRRGHKTRAADERTVRTGHAGVRGA